MAKGFFDERLDQSEVKARIVQKYFFAWANVIKGAAKKHGNKIAYIDLYCGPGRYKDGAASTPLLVLEKAIADNDMSEMLVTVFNDEDRNFSETLDKEIATLAGIEKLKHKPTIYCTVVDEDLEKKIADVRLVPSFTFFDPFGYRGLSSGIIRAFLKDWGCDCIFFFNYNRINPGLGNPMVAKHMDALFGKDRADALRNELDGKLPHEREALILEALAHALKEQGAQFVLPFRFRNAADTRTSHCLVFVTKHKKGYGLMKEIMASESALDQGVPSFSYFPATESTPLLFSLARPLDQLEDELLTEFSGRRLSMIEIFEQHNIDKPYIARNYKAALRNLEAANRITCDPSAEDRPKRKGQVTFADAVIATFPVTN